jgi:hypothetical protein
MILIALPSRVLQVQKHFTTHLYTGILDSFSIKNANRRLGGRRIQTSKRLAAQESQTMEIKA